MKTSHHFRLPGRPGAERPARARGKTPLWIRFVSLACLLSIAAAVYLGLGLLGAAQATSPAMDASCNQLSQYGFTTGLVYCIEASVGVAVKQYAAVMQTAMLPYEGMALAVAIAVFGIKMMNSNMQDPIKETSNFVIRVLVGVFFYNEAVAIYNDLAGPSGVINQAIGWVTGLSASGGGSGIFSSIISSNCTAPTAPSSYQGQQIWQAFDCMFERIFGAVSPSSGGGNAFFTSMIALVGASLFSGTLGVITTGFGVSLFMGVLTFVARALFLVLMSYLCIGFMAIFAPLMAPLLFFESKFLTEKFKQWLGIIISAIFQPVFVVGFLAFAITIDDMLIQGTMSNCTSPTFPSTSGSGSSPAAGWGQNGSGVCSFSQLFGSGQSGSSLNTLFGNLMQQNTTDFTMAVGGDPQGHGMGTSIYDPLGDSQQGLNVAKTAEINQAHQFATGAGHWDLGGITHLKPYFPTKQFLLTMLTFIFVNYVMKGLMEIIPKMAASMTIAAGVNLMEQMQLPLEGSIKSFMSGADGAMMKGARGTGLINGNLDGPAGMAKGLGDALLAGGRKVISDN